MKNFKKVKSMPTSGQFVVMWEWENESWSETFRWLNDIAVAYNSTTQSFDGGIIDDYHLDINDNVEFYVLKKPKPPSIYDATSVITCTNNAELQYVLAWCKSKGRCVGEWMTRYDINNGDIHLDISGSIVGLIDRYDSNVSYISFNDFLKQIVKEK